MFKIIKLNKDFQLFFNAKFVYFDKAMAARIQTHGVRVSIKRTITPAKYEAKTAYKMTI